MEFPTPSGNRIVRTLGSEGVFHPRIGCTWAEPWRGRGPLLAAGLSAGTLAAIEGMVRKETGGPFGYTLTLPPFDSKKLATLKSTLKATKGGLAAIESLRALADSRAVQPASDFQPRRFGFNPPSEIRGWRQDLAESVVSAAGIPVELLLRSDGAGMRESYRRMVLLTIQAVADAIAAEATAKLESEVSIDLKPLRSGDLQGLGRWVSGAVAAGMPLDAALQKAGLD